MTSLAPEYVPAGVDLSRCPSPAECHGSIPLSDQLRVHPFYADSSADFITGRAHDGLLLIVGEAGGALNCLDEGRTTSGCIADVRDIEEVRSDLEEYVALHDPQRVGALVYSWSVAPPDSQPRSSRPPRHTRTMAASSGLSLPTIADEVFAANP